MRFRSLEAALRSALVRWIGRGAPAPVADWGAGGRVLYLRYDRIGDMILSTGLIRAIAKSHPNLTVDVLASPENVMVLDGNPDVGSVIVADRRKPLSYLRAFRRIRRTRYDAIIDCQIFSPSTTTLVMMLASGARRRIGLGGRGVDDALTDVAPRQPAARHYIDNMAALAIPFGVDPAVVDWRPRIYLNPRELAEADARWPRRGPRRIVVNISAGRPSRQWPAERYSTILDMLCARGDLDILVIAAPGDAELAERLASGAGVVFARTGGVREALAIVASADFVLTPDTAICHAASAFSKPATVMFWRNRGDRWGLYRTGGQSVSTSGSSLDSLPVEPVRAALDVMLGAVTAPLEAASDAT